jgi:hypothetical protein
VCPLSKDDMRKIYNCFSSDILIFHVFKNKELENISRGSTFWDFVTIRTDYYMGRCGTSRLQDYIIQEYRLPSPLSFKYNVLRESLFVDSPNIPCATLERRGSWVISK